MLVIIGIRLDAPFIRKQIANFRTSVLASTLNRLEANRRSERILGTVAKTLDITEAGKGNYIDEISSAGGPSAWCIRCASEIYFQNSVNKL